MTENPANGLKDMMWRFLMDKGQKENIPELKAAVYRLIQMTTQKTAGLEDTERGRGNNADTSDNR